MAKRLAACLAKVKSEELFLEKFWLPHYSKHFEPCDLHVHSDGSLDRTEQLCRDANVNLTVVPPGAVAFGKNNVYVVDVITKLLEDYECVLFAESPDDVIVAGPEASGGNLTAYLEQFVKSPDRYRFLTGVNITHLIDSEPPYDPAKGTLISQRNTYVRCPQFDNPFLWKERPWWGRGWHDLGPTVNNGRRLHGMGERQGPNRQLYNCHLHYADFDLANARHSARKLYYTQQEQTDLYAIKTGDDLKVYMRDTVANPTAHFTFGAVHQIPAWMKDVI